MISGFSAYTICAYESRKGLLEILQENNCLKLNPDIIILQIGTNNIMDNIPFETTIQNFISLLDYIFKNINSNTILFVATIPYMNPNTEIVYSWFKNYRYSNDGKIHYEDKEVKDMVYNNVMKFNNEIKRVIDDYKNKNYKVRLENLNSVIKDLDNLLFDGVHPNDKGYKLIGDFWTKIIENYLNEIKNNI